MGPGVTGIPTMGTGDGIPSPGGLRGSGGMTITGHPLPPNIPRLAGGRLTIGVQRDTGLMTGGVAPHPPADPPLGGIPALQVLPQGHQRRRGMPAAAASPHGSSVPPPCLPPGVVEGRHRCLPPHSPRGTPSPLCSRPLSPPPPPSCRRLDLGLLSTPPLLLRPNPRWPQTVAVAHADVAAAREGTGRRRPPPPPLRTKAYASAASEFLSRVTSTCLSPARHANERGGHASERGGSRSAASTLLPVEVSGLPPGILLPAGLGEGGVWSPAALWSPPLSPCRRHPLPLAPRPTPPNNAA